MWGKAPEIGAGADNVPLIARELKGREGTGMAIV
jgi:hypothetical protein